MAHFEPHVPEGAQDGLDQFANARRYDRAVLVQKHQIDVATGAQFAPAKTANRHQRDAAPFFFGVEPLGGSLIHVPQDDVYDDRALLGDLASAAARLVFEPEPVILDPQEFFIERQEFGLIVHTLGGKFRLGMGQHQFPVPGQPLGQR